MIKIQLSNPTSLSSANSDDVNIEEAIESIFPLETEYAYLIWNNIHIPLSYKYDVSSMLSDLLKINSFLKNEKEKSLEIHWPSNTFAAIWFIDKESDLITITASWDCVLGSLKDLLNINHKVLVKTEELHDEIGRLISFIKKILDKAGYNSQNLEDYNLLKLY